MIAFVNFFPECPETIGNIMVDNKQTKYSYVAEFDALLAHAKGNVCWREALWWNINLYIKAHLSI